MENNKDYENFVERMGSFDLDLDAPYDADEVNHQDDSAELLSHILESDEFLEHYGVLGMRWGYRRDRRTGKMMKTSELKALKKQRRSEAKQQKKDEKQRKVERKENTVKVKEKTNEMLNEIIDARGKVEKKLEKNFKVSAEEVERAYAKAADSDPKTELSLEKKARELEKQFVKERADTYNKHFRENPQELPKGVTMQYDPNGSYNMRPTYKYNGKEFNFGWGNNDDFFILDPPKEVKHSIRDRDDFLQHYGVLGMRWGVRRDRVTGRRMPTKEYKALKKQRRQERKSRGSEDHREAQRLKKKRLEEMTNNEVQSLVRRMQLERQYKDTSKHLGQKMVEDILKETSKDLSKKYISKAASTVIDSAIKEVLEGNN